MANIYQKVVGSYIPSTKSKLIQENNEDKNDEPYQRLAWERMEKSINGLINKLNMSNISKMAKKLFQINLIRGRGLFCKSLMRAQASSPTFTHVYAALVAACNTKFPKVGELLIKRLIVQFKQTFQRNDKCMCINTLKFIAHLFNQQIIDELLPLQILVLVLHDETNDSVEIAIAFLKQCGAKLDEISKVGLGVVFETLRKILQDSATDKRIQYMIEMIFVIRKDKFRNHQPFEDGLDLIEEDQFTHSLNLDDDYDTEDIFNIFMNDDHYQENEAKYKAIRSKILGEQDSSDDDDSDTSDSEEEKREPIGTNEDVIIDATEFSLLSLRKIIYLIITSSLDFEECAHKLFKLRIKSNQILELCRMIVDCCCVQSNYMKFFGLLAQKLCSLNSLYIDPFIDIFSDCYTTIHRFESYKLRNCATFFAYLLATNSIALDALKIIRLNEDEINPSNRVFIRYLFEQLIEAMGKKNLLEKIRDPDLRPAFSGLFPTDDPKKIRFCIDFFSSIQLQDLIDDLRNVLKTMEA